MPRIDELNGGTIVTVLDGTELLHVYDPDGSGGYDSVPTTPDAISVYHAGAGNPVTGVVRGAFQTLSSSGGAVALGMAGNPRKRLTLNENTTITVSGEVAGQVVEVWIEQGATGGTAAWAGVDKWRGGSAPTLSTTTGQIDVVLLSVDSDGATVLGEHVGVYS